MTMWASKTSAALLLPAVSLFFAAKTGTTTSRFALGFAVVPQPSPSSPSRGHNALVSVRGGDGTMGGSVSTSVLAVASETALDLDEACSGVSLPVPSWESLEAQLEDLQEKEKPKPVLTLYRDTNGWCPFCERVWVAIRAKGLPYQETLVPLQGKPEWYKQMVPTGLVPAVMFHGNDDDDNSSGSNTTSRTLVWESDAILHALDEQFPDTIRLMKDPDDADFTAAMELSDRLQKAGFQFMYGGRNETVTEQEKKDMRDKFEAVLNELDTALGEQQQKIGVSDDTDNPGCFRLGTEFSAMDAIMIPTMERWRYQLPITVGLDILENRNNLRRWFEHMDEFAPYADRVKGDEYSWVATASQFLRYFGGGEDKPDVKAGIERADRAAQELADKFAESYQGNNDSNNQSEQSYALEAAAKLIMNHDAVVSDCVREDPKSQKHVARAATGERDTADAALRHVASVLVHRAAGPGSTSDGGAAASAVSIEGVTSPTQGALALRTVATRLCVPRDMGAPAAALFRGVLTTVADGLLVDIVAAEEE